MEASKAFPGYEEIQPAPGFEEIHILWTSEGMGCDGDTVSVTAPQLPRLEDVLLGHVVAVGRAHQEPVRPVHTDDARHHEQGRETLASAHAVLTVAGGAFRSAIESTELLSQDGLWPVLVGGPGTSMLASSIILPDYPRVAPESPGDFFDGCEIDQLLVLNILALTDDEQAEIRAGDPRARAILERTEAMSPEDLMRLHGTWREP